MTNPAAWHPDPIGAHEYRWWDGERWTEHVADQGQAAVDPLPGGPGTDPAGDEHASSTSGQGTPSDTGEPGHEPGAASWQQPDTSPDTSTEQPAQAPSWGHSSTGEGSSQQGWQQGQQPPSWQQPQTGSQASTGSNGVAIAAMVVGILSLLISWVPLIGLLGGLGGIVAIILGFIGKRNAGASGNGRGAAITGIVTGIVALLASIAITVGLVAFGTSFVDGYAQCIEEGGTPESCEGELEEDLLDRFGT